METYEIVVVTDPLTAHDLHHLILNFSHQIHDSRVLPAWNLHYQHLGPDETKSCYSTSVAYSSKAMKVYFEQMSKKIADEKFALSLTVVRPFFQHNK